jgi:hypothetical protein
VAYKPDTNAAAQQQPDDLESMGVAVSGTVTDLGDGTYDVSFTPTESGSYQIVVSMATQLEVQKIKTQFADFERRGGTFTVYYMQSSTSPLAHDASADAMRSALLELPTLSGDVSVSRSPTSDGFEYEITFLSVVDDVELFTASNQHLSSGASVEVTRAQQCQSEHIQTYTRSLEPEIQQITLDVTSGDTGSFKL